MTIIGRDEMVLRNIDTECIDSPTGKHEPRPDRWGDDICIWCLEEPVPDSIADIAAEHGVTEAQLRQALSEAHPDAGVAEVILAAREIVQ